MIRIAVALGSLWLATASSAQVKVFISVDMEGIAGAVTGEQLGPTGFEYQRFREFMTEEVLAAIRGARAAGATEFLVADSHGNGQNLLIDKLPKDVRIIRSWPRPLGMSEGIDESFAAALYIAYHSSTSNSEGVRAHTFSSATLTDVRLNGVSMSEASFNAAVAGHFGVPVVMISGDDAIVDEARRLLGDVEGAVVKQALSFHSANTLTPEAARELIEERAKRGVERRASMKPFRIEGPVTLEVSFKNYRQAEMLSYLDVVERIDSHSIRFVGADMVAVAKFVQFMNGYGTDLTP